MRVTRGAIVVVTAVAAAWAAWAACGKSSMDAHDEYILRSKASEAKVGVMALVRGAQAYYDEEHVARGSFEVATHQLPANAGPTPDKGACCAGGGECAPDPTLWEHDTWRALMFSMDDPYRYSYQWEVTTEPDGSRVFVASAYGDLDCDGQYSTYVLRGTESADTGMVWSKESIATIDPLE